MSFVNENDEFVTALATSNDGVLSIVADTLHGYSGFGFYAPAINTRGQVAFRGFLADFSTDGIFTGPDPKKNAIITSRDKLDGARIISGSFSVCAEALNDAGEIAFIVDLVDNTQLEGLRTAIYVASPRNASAVSSWFSTGIIAGNKGKSRGLKRRRSPCIANPRSHCACSG